MVPPLASPAACQASHCSGAIDKKTYCSTIGALSNTYGTENRVIEFFGCRHVVGTNHDVTEHRLCLLLVIVRSAVYQLQRPEAS